MSLSKPSSVGSALIEELQKHIFLPEILNEIPIINYMQCAVQFHDDSLQPSQYLQGRYISLKRFLEFAVRLHKHNGYSAKSVQKERMFLERCMQKSITELEIVVRGLREQELQMQKDELRQQQEDLYDLFEDEAIPVTASVSASAAAASVPMPSAPYMPDPVQEVGAATSSRFARLALQPSVVPSVTQTQMRGAVFDRLRTPESSFSLPAAAAAPPASQAVLEFYALRGTTKDENVEIGSELHGLAVTDVQLARCLAKNINHVDPGRPYVTEFYLPIGGVHGSGGISFPRHDYHVNYTAVLRGVPPQLQMAKSAIETNRCFFLHLGIAISIHPFLLQCAFRHFAQRLLNDKTDKDAVVWEDILPSVLGYAYFVDLNALIWLWMEEFRPYRICVLSGSQHQPLLSTFRTKGVDVNTLQDVLIHCDGKHFTLLLNPGTGRGQIATSVVPMLIQATRAVGGVVQEHELNVRPGHSIRAVVTALSK